MKKHENIQMEVDGWLVLGALGCINNENSEKNTK